MSDVSFNIESFNTELFIPRHRRPHVVEWMKKYRRELKRKRRAEYLADKSCLECTSILFLEIHHRDPNQKIDHKNIWFWRKERRDEELAKCDVLCDVCHNKTKYMSKLLRMGWTGWRGDGRI